MIRALWEQPEIFSQLKEPFDWFWEGYNEKGPYGYMAAKRELDKAVLHLELLPSRFVPSTFKCLKHDWYDVRYDLRAHGIKVVVACCPPDNNRMIRIWQLFGFPKPEILALSYMEV